MTLLLERTAGIIPTLTLGDRLRVARRRTGLESGPFADEINLSRVTVSKYENDRVSPHPNNLRLWAEATGVDFHWIVTGHEKTPADESTGVCDLCALTGSNRGPADYGLVLDKIQESVAQLDAAGRRVFTGVNEYSLPQFDTVADLLAAWQMPHYCKFCGRSFYTSSDRHAHELTCQPWEHADDALRMWAVAR